MVQMGDSVAAERCLQHLNNIPVCNGGKIQIAFSKQNFLFKVINPFLLPDHTPSFKKYTGSKNNCFLSPAQCNDLPIEGKGTKFLFFMKLCFPSSKSMNGAWNNATNEGMTDNEIQVKQDVYN